MPCYRLEGTLAGQISSSMRTLFLNPPSFKDFDGGAGARWQATREVRSFWFPVWLAQAAALINDSRVLDAPVDGLSIEDTLEICKDYDLVVIYTSTPGFNVDAKLVEQIKDQKPGTLVGFVGPHVTVLPEESLQSAPALDFVVRKEFDYPIRDLAYGCAFPEIKNLSWRDGNTIRHNKEAPLLNGSDLDKLPFVIDVYKRDLTIENYYIGAVLHPYISLYTGRGCVGACTYCLWPQTIGSRGYRARSPESVYQEMALAKDYFPQVKEFFFDDDTFTGDFKRAEDIARLLKPLGITWSANGRPNVPYETLKILKECGMRMIIVGYESGSDKILSNIHKGITTSTMRKFSSDCKSLGIKVHGCFIVGLPGETEVTLEETKRFADEVDPDTVQVSVPAPYPGTELYQQSVENCWLKPNALVWEDGTQVCPIEYENLSSSKISKARDNFYKHYYSRPKVIFRIVKEMIKDPYERRRRLREGREFLEFLRKQK